MRKLKVVVDYIDGTQEEFEAVSVCHYDPVLCLVGVNDEQYVYIPWGHIRIVRAHLIPGEG
jgi:hypothetical protein